MSDFFNILDSLKHFYESTPRQITVKIRDFFILRRIYELVFKKMHTCGYKRRSDTFEVHTILSHHAVIFYIIGIYSLLRFLDRIPKIFAYDDGSLKKDDYLLLGIIPNIRIITTKEAKKRADMAYRAHTHLLQSREESAYDRKLIDIPLYCSKRKKIFILDSDVIFFKKPTALLKYLLGDTHPESVMYLQDIQDSYVLPVPDLNKLFSISCRKRVNTGILVLYPSVLSVSGICNYYKKIRDSGIDDIFIPWREQTGYAVLTANVRARFLPNEYKIGAVTDNSTVCCHYVHGKRDSYCADLQQFYFYK